jgi:hypothetical protein
LDYKITPVALTAPDLRWRHVRSSTTHRAVSHPKCVIGALPHRRPPRRSACEQSREEPAIPSLDWTFTPIRRSTERFAHHNPVGPPPHFRRASSCLRIDRLASGRPPVTPGECTVPLVNCGHIAFATAPAFNALTSPLDSTPWPVFQNVREDTAPPPLGGFVAFMPRDICSRMVSGSFHFPSRVLCSFHSRYYCAIGLRTCLGFEDGAPEFARDFQRVLLWIPPITVCVFPYRTITLCGTAFQRTSGDAFRCARVHNSTTPLSFPSGFGLPCSLFDRLY